MAAPTLHERRVDVGAAYLTVSDAAFGAVVERWRDRGLARPWTDTFAVHAASGVSSRTGPMRWAAPAGLRSLVRDLHEQVEVGAPVERLPAGYDATVLAMPDPQAARLAGSAFDWVDYEPVVAVAAGWPRRAWSVEAAFVNDDPDLALVVDDGARRGDGAPVLVAHTTPERARAHLDDPAGAVAPVLEAVRRTFGVVDPPAWTHAHRWRFAKPAATHGDAPFGRRDRLAICGDSWCPAGSPRVEAAWLSGDRLGADLAARLG